MKHELSGNIYRFHLEANLQLDAYCQLLDFSDIKGLDGRLITVFKLLDNNTSKNTSIEEIKESGILFGPIPLFNYPNVRGKGSWRLVGKDKDYSREIPTVKNVQDNYTKKDWTRIGPWFKVVDFEKRIKCEDYEEVRPFEIQVLKSMHGIEIRTTMHVIILKGEDVSKYYDLRNFNLQCIYIEVINTSFSKEKADELMKSIPERI